MHSRCFHSTSSLLLEYCLAASKRRAHVVVMQCTAQTRSSHILDRLSQSCVTMTGSSVTGASRVLRPKEGDRLVLFLRDLNLPKPDKWGSCEIVAFLQQVSVMFDLNRKISFLIPTLCELALNLGN